MNLDRRNCLRAAVPAGATATVLLGGSAWQPLLAQLSGTPGFEVKSYCALFDTVFVSVYKFFGAPFGAILAGKQELIAQARELRHTFGA